MFTLRRSIALGAVIFTAVGVITFGKPVAAADADIASPQVAATTLPEVVVRPGSQGGYYMAPYVNGYGYKTQVQLYQVPADFDRNVALHPYTSRLGPCVDGSNPGGCPPVPPSHYNPN